MQVCILYNRYYLSYSRRNFQNPFSERYAFAFKAVCVDQQPSRARQNMDKEKAMICMAFVSKGIRV